MHDKEPLISGSGGIATPDFVPYSFPSPDSGSKESSDFGAIVDVRPGLKIELIRKQNLSGKASKYSAKLVDHLTIGRSQESAIQIPDSEISGQHCKLELVSGLVLLSDAGSTFGTMVNGVPIKARHKIESGDWVTLGKVEFRVQILK
jgi:hypothetical protein